MHSEVTSGNALNARAAAVEQRNVPADCVKLFGSQVRVLLAHQLHDALFQQRVHQQPHYFMQRDIVGRGGARFECVQVHVRLQRVHPAVQPQSHRQVQVVLQLALDEAVCRRCGCRQGGDGFGHIIGLSGKVARFGVAVTHEIAAVQLTGHVTQVGCVKGCTVLVQQGEDSVFQARHQPVAPIAVVKHDGHLLERAGMLFRIVQCSVSELHDFPPHLAALRCNQFV